MATTKRAKINKRSYSWIAPKRGSNPCKDIIKQADVIPLLTDFENRTDISSIKHWVSDTVFLHFVYANKGGYLTATWKIKLGPYEYMSLLPLREVRSISQVLEFAKRVETHMDKTSDQNAVRKFIIKERIKFIT